MQKSKLQIKIKKWQKILIFVFFIIILVGVFSYFDGGAINFLNQNSGAAIVIFTAMYVIGTLLMWWEMRKSRLGLDEPRIQISLVPRRVRHENIIDLVIENVGNVPIIDLMLNFDPPELKNSYGRKLSEIFKEPIKTLGRNKSIKIFLFRKSDLSKVKRIKISTEYKSLYCSNVERKLDFIFDIENFDFADMPYEYGTEDLINAIRGIEGNLQGLYHQLDGIQSIMAREEMERNRIKPFEINGK